MFFGARPAASARKENAEMDSPYLSRLARGIEPYVPGEQPTSAGLIKLNTNENH